MESVGTQRTGMVKDTRLQHQGTKAHTLLHYKTHLQVPIQEWTHEPTLNTRLPGLIPQPMSEGIHHPVRQQCIIHLHVVKPQKLWEAQAKDLSSRTQERHQHKMQGHHLPESENEQPAILPVHLSSVNLCHIFQNLKLSKYDRERQSRESM